MEENPILRTPYEEPVSYHELDAIGRMTGNILRGRRPSESTIGVPDPTGETIVDNSLLEPHKTINELREEMKRWRAGGWQGTTTKTRKLLDFWHSSDPGIGMRPFWCQLEAIETAIWLFEAGEAYNPEFHKRVVKRLAKASERHNDGILRTTFKMATGTGKTNVMAMLMLWMLANGTGRDDSGITNFLIISPGLTVKRRLAVLDPKNKDEVWDAITPREFRRILHSAQVTVVNFHVLKQQAIKMGGKALGVAEKRLLGNSNSGNLMESEPDMIDRVLKSHAGGSKVTVINDEAHHCYKPLETAAGSRDDEEYQEAAAIWFKALQLLRNQNRLERVYDFSATPMWLAKPQNLYSEIFPWTVSDFSLLDAIESGLVKIPRVPVSDDTESHDPKYRNIYDYNQGKNLTRSLALRVQEPLKQLYTHYSTVIDSAYRKIGITPVFIIVVNNIKNAVVMYKWIAGHYDSQAECGAHGNLELLSNYNRDGSMKEHPPTLLVHSRLLDPKSESRLEKEAVVEQAGLFGLEGSVAEKREQIRSLFTSVGHGRGRNIRCVISVGMLTEGWDAKNVTHVFGYRRFGSLLLCEQVTGRSLRRTSFVGDKKQKPEYANIFGVPYTFARGGDADPQPPAQHYEVFSIPGREGLRIEFPAVVGYRNPTKQRRFTLNPAKVKPYTVKPSEPKKTRLAGAIGTEFSTTRSRRVKAAMWETANDISKLLNQDFGESDEPHVPVSRRISFGDSYKILKEWLVHPAIKCDDPVGLTADQHVPQMIAEACEHNDEELKTSPIFADDRRDGERFMTTEDVHFKTTLEHRYRNEGRGGQDTLDGTDPGSYVEKSELNKAACHTREETHIAEILDTHPKIEAWARNFRLGFKVPWFNTETSSWVSTEPDFVARVKTGDGRRLHLVIEFKGLKKHEAEEQMKRYYTERWWCPSVSEYNGGQYGQWKAVWIEDVRRARLIISEACA